MTKRIIAICHSDPIIIRRVLTKAGACAPKVCAGPLLQRWLLYQNDTEI